MAISIFTIIFTVGVGGFVSAMRTQRQLQALISANSNASLVIEQMSREIRTGLGFLTASPDCGTFPLPCELSFTNVKGERVIYRWNRVTEETLRISPNNLSGEPITARNVAVRYLGFSVLGECASSNATPSHGPRITMVLGISPRSERGVRDDITRIQTTVSSRQGFICDHPGIEVGL